MPNMTYEEAVEFARYNWADDESRYVAARMIGKVYDVFIDDVWRDVCNGIAV